RHPYLLLVAAGLDLARDRRPRLLAHRQQAREVVTARLAPLLLAASPDQPRPRRDIPAEVVGAIDQGRAAAGPEPAGERGGQQAAGELVGVEDVGKLGYIGQVMQGRLVAPVG